MSNQQTEKQIVGQKGEEIACMFLKKHSFEIIDRNYRKKWGEIDIVAKKNDILHFIEVKSVARVTNNQDKNWYRPEENVHPWKIKRLSRVIQTYLLDKKIPDEMEWIFDVITVSLDYQTKKAQVKILENIVL